MRARLRSVSVRHVVAVLALAFFCAPLALRAVGMTAREFENRPMATFPKLSQGWDALEQGKRFLVDRLPLREQAVRADAWISSDIFDTDPAAGRAGAKGPAGLPAPKPPPAAAAAPAPAGDKPVAGTDGWLFLEGEFVRACAPFIAWPKAMLRWERLAAVIRRSGRRVVLVFPPDKSTIHPEYLPASFAQRACLGPGHDAAWAAIEGATDPAVLGLRRAMLAAKAPGTSGPYYRKDTHWNTMGGTIGVRELLERLGVPGVRMRDDEIVKGREEYGGDLATLSGAPQTDTAPQWTIRRRAGARRLPGRTLFLHDSYGNAMQDALVGYLADPALLEWYGKSPAALIAAIRGADTVVLETVEREINYKASDLGLLTPSFFAALRRALPQRE
jgi:hypothetical protein